MSPSKAEVYIPNKERWVDLGEQPPGSPPGSFSNVRENGAREIILFECAEDDSETRVYKSGFGLDAELGEEGELRQVIYDPEKLETIKALKKGESHEMEIKTDRNIQSKIRISHV